MTATIAEIVAYIRPFMAEPERAEAVAAAILSAALAQRADPDDHLRGELAGRYTLDGDPIAFSI